MKQKKENPLELPAQLSVSRGLGELKPNSRRTILEHLGHRGLFVVLFAVVILVVVVSFVFHFQASAPGYNQPERKDFLASELPGGVPADLPYIDHRDMVVHNYTLAAAENHPMQSVRKWGVEASLPDAFTIFKDYFKTHGWQITTEVNKGVTHVLAARKKDRLLTVSLTETTVSGNNKVLIEVTAR